MCVCSWEISSSIVYMYLIVFLFTCVCVCVCLSMYLFVCVYLDECARVIVKCYTKTSITHFVPSFHIFKRVKLIFNIPLPKVSKNLKLFFWFLECMFFIFLTIQLKCYLRERNRRHVSSLISHAVLASFVIFWIE